MINLNADIVEYNQLQAVACLNLTIFKLLIEFRLFVWGFSIV